MTEYMAGGRRRIDRVLDPAFLEGLTGLSLEDVRARRAEADQEEVDLSYARRLLHGRLDLLRAEQERRRGEGPLANHDHSDQAIADALSRILADDSRTARGLGRHLSTEPSRVGEHRREAERAVDDLGASNPAGLTDAGVDQAIARLTEVETKVSRARRQVQQVCDQLTAEIARRYQRSASPIDDIEQANAQV